eukprot:scaffold532526_cov33-Prasinocladus_malaysianus.AAC.1
MNRNEAKRTGMRFLLCLSVRTYVSRADMSPTAESRSYISDCSLQKMIHICTIQYYQVIIITQAAMTTDAAWQPAVAK